MHGHNSLFFVHVLNFALLFLGLVGKQWSMYSVWLCIGPFHFMSTFPPPPPIEVQGNRRQREGVSKFISEGVAMSVPFISQKPPPFSDIFFFLRCKISNYTSVGGGGGCRNKMEWPILNKDQTTCKHCFLKFASDSHIQEIAITVKP